MQSDCLLPTNQTIQIEIYEINNNDEHWTHRKFTVAKKSLTEIQTYLMEKEDAIFTPYYNAGLEASPKMSRLEAKKNVV